MYRVRLGAALLILSLTVPSQGANLPTFSKSSDPIERDKLLLGSETKGHTQDFYAASSPGWYWVYEGIAHGQSFVALETQIEAIRLRVARLNGKEPTAPLQVEIRDRSLSTIFAQGTIAPDRAQETFQWASVNLEYRASLKKGYTYILLVHSKETTHDGPWLVNAVFANPYPNGRHLGYQDDLIFSISFNGRGLHVGPLLHSSPTLPHNSGRPGGIAVRTEPSLHFGGFTRPAATALDPLGPLPKGQRFDVQVGVAP